MGGVRAVIINQMYIPLGSIDYITLPPDANGSEEHVANKLTGDVCFKVHLPGGAVHEISALALYMLIRDEDHAGAIRRYGDVDDEAQREGALYNVITEILENFTSIKNGD